MGYCDYTELQDVSGSDLADTILSAIIADADREIDTFLAPYNLTGSSSGACKTASLKLSQAGVLAYGGNYATIPGGYIAIESLRRQAYEILDRYVNENKASASYKMVVRV